MNFKQKAVLATVALITLIALGLDLLASGVRAAEDPARFLAVVSWDGEYGHDVTGTYVSPGYKCEQVYTLGQNLHAQGIVLSDAGNLDHGRTWESAETQLSVQGGVTDRAEGSCVSDVATVSLVSVYGPFQLSIDPGRNQYVVGFGGINLELVSVGGPGGPIREPLAIGWGPLVTNALPQSGMTLNGSAAVPLKLTPDSLQNGIFAPIWAYLSGEIQLVVSWTLTPHKDVDLKIISVETPFLVDRLHTFVAPDQIVLKAQAKPMIADLPVKWTVTGGDAAAGVSGFPANQERRTDAQGVSTFTFGPAGNPTFANLRHTTYTNGSRIPNLPLSFEVTAQMTLGETVTAKLSETTLGLLKQDETDTLRQEYWDFKIPLPSRDDATPSLGGYYNRGAYGVQLSRDLENHYNGVLNAYRGSTITVNGQAANIPATASMVITVGGGFRNPRINIAAGSLHPDSRHTRGRALDLKPIVFDVMLNGQRTPVSLHGALFPALRIAALTQGSAIAERGNVQLAVGDPSEDHIHVEW